MPEWYRAALFNELYYLVAGGTIWVNDHIEMCDVDGEGNESHKGKEKESKKKEKEQEENGKEESEEEIEKKKEWKRKEREIGKFAYLEGHEYLMYNTYDVHFYASFALGMCWPLIEMAIQRDFARATLLEEKEQHLLMAKGVLAPRKLCGMYIAKEKGKQRS